MSARRCCKATATGSTRTVRGRAGTTSSILASLPVPPICPPRPDLIGRSWSVTKPGSRQARPMGRRHFYTMAKIWRRDVSTTTPEVRTMDSALPPLRMDSCLCGNDFVGLCLAHCVVQRKRESSLTRCNRHDRSGDAPYIAVSKSRSHSGIARPSPLKSLHRSDFALRAASKSSRMAGYQRANSVRTFSRKALSSGSLLLFMS